MSCYKSPSPSIVRRPTARVEYRGSRWSFHRRPEPGPTATVRERSKFVSDLGPGWIHDANPRRIGAGRAPASRDPRVEYVEADRYWSPVRLIREMLLRGPFAPGRSVTVAARR